jgi:chromosome segregation ATPase
MTSQKTIERCRAKVKELEETNATLLHNNVVMAESNKKLREELARLNTMSDNQHTRILQLEKEKSDCKQKCEVVISEKDRIIQQKEQYIRNLHSTVWHLQNTFKCSTYGFNEIPGGFELRFGFTEKKA